MTLAVSVVPLTTAMAPVSGFIPTSRVLYNHLRTGASPVPTSQGQTLSLERGQDLLGDHS